MFFNLKKEVSTINVAVCGPHGSGKSKIIESLSNRTFTRSTDKRAFRLVLTEINHESMSLFSDYDFALFTFKSTNRAGRWGEWSTFRDIINRDYPDYSARTCLVGTMVDLVPPDSAQDIALQCLPSTVAYYSRLKFISASSVTGAGIQMIASYIMDQLFPPPLPSMPWSVLLDRLGNNILDKLASLFSLPVPPNVNQDTIDTEEINDDNITALYQSPDCQAHNAYLASVSPKTIFGSGCPAYRITPSLIAKSVRPIEFSNTVYARTHLKTPVPQPRYPNLTRWFVTDFVKGKTLFHCWESLGTFMKFRIACTLRTYVSEMRRLHRDTPGSPDTGHVHGYIFSFGLYAGPHASGDAFQRYVEAATYDGWELAWESYREGVEAGGSCVRPEEPIFLTKYNSPLVFTHADLGPTNILLSDDGILWIIDWATCGFYPRWVENLGMHRYDETFPSPKSWQYLAWLVVGPRPSNFQTWVHYYLSGSDRYSSFEPANEIIY